MSKSKITFNKPYLCGNELKYIKDAVSRKHLSGNGYYTNKCQDYFETRYNFTKCLLTQSGTGALEMAATLLNIEPGDEVIIPSYTFTSTANAFILRGASVRFIDSRRDHPGMDENSIESLITEKTKAIVVVHYAGIACYMEEILKIAEKYNLYIVEDAAHAIDSHYHYLNPEKKSRPLGGIGHIGAFSFHETKNIISGEGGMITVNDPALVSRAEIIWEKGTDRAAFFRGEVDKYGWKDEGSSFLPSEITAAFLWAQIENLDFIQKKRLAIWETYQAQLSDWAKRKSVNTPFIPSYAENNAHMYYLVPESLKLRNHYIHELKKSGIEAIFHYQSLHSSTFFKNKHDGRELTESDRYSDCLMRLPLFVELTSDDQKRIIDTLKSL